MRSKRLICLILLGSIGVTSIPIKGHADEVKKKSVENIVNYLDKKIIEEFKHENGWSIEGAKAKYSNEGGIFELTNNNAMLTKSVSYQTFDYSDLAIKIKEISKGMTWSLSVKGMENNAKEIVIQKKSGNANSKFGESFKYSLEGIAGSEEKSNWNDEKLYSKDFKIIIKLEGKVGDKIKIGNIERIKPNYEVKKASPSNVKGMVGNVNFDGDKNLNIEEIKNDDKGNSLSSNIKEFMWMSLPYSRLVVNPGYEFDNGKTNPVDKDLDLIFGTYYGINGNANKVSIDGKPIREGKSGFQASSRNCIINIDGQKIEGSSIKSAWYPHKLERSGEVKGKGEVSLVDYMIDENTIGRIIDTSKMKGDYLNIGIEDSSKNGTDFRNANNLKSRYDKTIDAVIKSDELFNDYNKNLFFQAMRVVALNEDGSINSEQTKIIQKPEFKDGKGEYKIPKEIKKVGIVIGYSNKEEGLETGIKRSNKVNDNMTVLLNERKSQWEKLLRKVPAPQKWGIEDNNILNGNTVTEEKHKVLYYAGWVHNLINIMPPTQETGYSYSQQALGKPSRQVGGAKMTPANNSWEGLLQVQNLMYVDTEASWSALEGFMAMVDANGFLDGEVLPVRMAQTIKMVHDVSPDKERLKELYPTLKRHLQYKISDPRWIYGNEKTENEIDQEYMTSWLNDARYMIKICEELGGEYKEDIEYWESEYDKALKNYMDWFFTDPKSHEAIGSYPQDGTGIKNMRNGANLPDANYQRGLWTRIFQKDGDVNYFKDSCENNTDGTTYVHSKAHKIEPHNPARYPREWLQVILSGLVVKDIETKEAKQLEQFFMDINNPSLPLSGIENCKWAPNSLLIYGLINRGYYDEAKNQLDSYLVKSVEIWEFCENYFYNQTGPKGTSPTSFGASQIIELTMLKNGVINDGSGLREIDNWEKGKNKAKFEKVKVQIDKEIDIKNTTIEELNLPKEIKGVYKRKNFNNEEFEINKITNVKWDMSTLKENGSKKYKIKGRTENHIEIDGEIKIK